MEEERYEIRLSGSGGQGIIMAAIVLAEAAGVYDEKYVCQSQSYGPEARGGTSKAEVIISNQTIDYPKAIKPDLLLTMNQEACNTYFPDLKAEGCWWWIPHWSIKYRQIVWQPFPLQELRERRLARRWSPIWLPLVQSGLPKSYR